jgi:hypothetical protein
VWQGWKQNRKNTCTPANRCYRCLPELKFRCQPMRWFAFMSLAVLTAICGCAHAPPSPPPPPPIGTVVEYHPRETPLTTHVAYDGVYTLLALDQPQMPNPVLTAQAWRGTRIGFLRLRDHSVVAVVGKARFPIPEGSYVWLAPSDNSGMARPIGPPVPSSPPLLSPPPPAPPAQQVPPGFTAPQVPSVPSVPQPMP